MSRGYVRALDGSGAEDQLARLAAAGCAEALLEREAGPAARRRLDQYLYDLPAGEELFVVSLEALGRSTGKLVLILHDLFAKGCVVRVLEPEPLRLHADFSDARLLALLHRHETERSRERYGEPDSPGRGGRKRALTLDEAAEALRRFAAGEGLAAIARVLGAPRGAVVQALNGRRRLGETRRSDGTARRVRTSLGPAPPLQSLATAPDTQPS